MPVEDCGSGGAPLSSAPSYRFAGGLPFRGEGRAIAAGAPLSPSFLEVAGWAALSSASTERRLPSIALIAPLMNPAPPQKHLGQECHDAARRRGRDGADERQVPDDVADPLLGLYDDGRCHLLALDEGGDAVLFLRERPRAGNRGP
jgi:hypothetical protein